MVSAQTRGSKEYQDVFRPLDRSLWDSFAHNNRPVPKEEVDDVKWATIEEIQKMRQQEIFSESHKAFFEDCLKYLNGRIVTEAEHLR
ncbi:MAG: hypothetical protein RSE00_05880 [Clostridia bacterium]